MVLTIFIFTRHLFQGSFYDYRAVACSFTAAISPNPQFHILRFHTWDLHPIINRLSRAFHHQTQSANHYCKMIVMIYWPVLQEYFFWYFDLFCNNISPRKELDNSVSGADGHDLGFWRKGEGRLMNHLIGLFLWKKMTRSWGCEGPHPPLVGINHIWGLAHYECS